MVDKDEKLIRKCLKAQIGNNESNNKHYVYMGAITSKDNPNLGAVLDEYETFGLDLTIAK